MLVLSRNAKESVVIGAGAVTITVLAIEDGRVKLGIVAPKSVRVDREEIHKRRQEHALNIAQCLSGGLPATA